MTVERRPVERDEQRAALDRARVGRDAGELAIRADQLRPARDAAISLNRQAS